MSDNNVTTFDDLRALEVKVQVLLQEIRAWSPAQTEAATKVLKDLKAKRMDGWWNQWDNSIEKIRNEVDLASRQVILETAGDTSEIERAAVLATLVADLKYPTYHPRNFDDHLDQLIAPVVAARSVIEYNI